MGALSVAVWVFASGAVAGPITTDTIPGNRVSNSADWAYKLDVIEVDRASRLLTASPWLRFDRGARGGDLLHVAVYAETGPGTHDWEVVFDSGMVGPVGDTGGFYDVNVDLPLEAGRRYAVGMVFEEGNYEYRYESGPGVTDYTWGSHVGAIYVGEDALGAFPTRIDDAVPGDVGYWQEVTIEVLDVDGDGVTEDLDCDDLDPANFPGSPEWCDGADNDCTGAADDPIDYVDWFPDADGDGYGEQAAVESRCEPEPPVGRITTGGDCDDADPDIRPGVDEYCDGVDDDCDGAVDEDPVTSAAFEDLDGDGSGGAPATYCTRERPPELVGNDDDCDDTDPTVYPRAPEVCDGLDQDCDGLVDDGLPRVLVFADEDLDGAGDPDADLEWCPDPPEGYVTNTRDCDDTDPRRARGNEEVCDGVDNDCDGEAPGEGDTDGDGFVDCGDCDPADGSVYPGAPEACDGVDHDCDGVALTRLDCDPAPTEEVSVVGCGGCDQGGAGGVAWLGILAVAAAGARRRW
jgi:hypothetical protein